MITTNLTASIKLGKHTNKKKSQGKSNKTKLKREDSEIVGQNLLRETEKMYLHEHKHFL